MRHEIDYVRPAVLGDTIVTTGWLESVERASFWCDFEMRRASNDDLHVRAHQKLAFVQMPQGRPVRIPAECAPGGGLHGVLIFFHSVPLCSCHVQKGGVYCSRPSSKGKVLG